MPESGQSWQRNFAAGAEQAHEARTWVCTHSQAEGTAQIVGELFVAVLSVHPSKVTLTLSTAGARTRITASGDRPLPLHALRGPGRAIPTDLAAIHGVTVDGCGIWAELPMPQ